MTEATSSARNSSDTGKYQRLAVPKVSAASLIVLWIPGPVFYILVCNSGRSWVVFLRLDRPDLDSVILGSRSLFSLASHLYCFPFSLQSIHKQSTKLTFCLAPVLASSQTCVVSYKSLGWEWRQVVSWTDGLLEVRTRTQPYPFTRGRACNQYEPLFSNQHSKCCSVLIVAKVHWDG